MERLSFINSEVHRQCTPLFRQDAPEDTREYARKNLRTRLDHLQRTIGAQTFVTAGQFTVADPCLFTVLGWGAHVDVDIGCWPELKRCVERIGQRPHVIAAFQAEGLLKQRCGLRPGDRWTAAV